MPRRHFLRLIGAVLATPAVPMAASAGHSGTAVQAAIAHAQKFPVISVSGLAKCAKLSTAQAESAIKELARRDLVKLVGPSQSGAPRAASKILINDPWGLGRTAEPTKVSTAEVQSKQRNMSVEQHEKPIFDVDLDPLLAHLRGLCVKHGMTLSPRCNAGAIA